MPLNAWWTGPELEYGLERLRVGGRVRRRRAQRTARRAPDRAPRAARRHRRQSRARARGSGASGSRMCSAMVAGRRGAARRRARSRGRRDDLLHVGHDRTAEGRARHPAQHLHQPDEPRVLRRPGEPPADAPSRRRLPSAAAPSGAERVPAVGAVLPRHRLPLGPRGQPRVRREDRDHVQVGRRPRARADRARARHDVRRRAGDGVAGARPSRLRQARSVERQVDRLRRRARRARARASHRGDVPRAHAEQRLRAHRDLVGHDDELRCRLPRASPRASACPCPCAT